MTRDAPGSFELAVLDASRFTSGSASERKAFANDLCKALTEHGFVKITNHGIPSSMVAEAFTTSKKFFELPLSVKQKIEHTPGPNPQRGWSSVGSESTAKLFGALTRQGETITDTDSKEHFDSGAATDPRFTNKWPSEAELPGMRALLEGLYERCHYISMQLLEAMEIALELPVGTFTSRCQEQADELRMNHYPAISTSQAASRINRVWPHTDLGIITCLFQDDVGGLEIEDRKQQGRFQAIPPGVAGELIVNVSETFERWTNGTIKAGVHDVRLPEDLMESWEERDNHVIPERFSIPYFVKADRGACVGPLAEFVSDERPSSYPAMTALEYHMQRVARAY